MNESNSTIQSSPQILVALVFTVTIAIASSLVTVLIMTKLSSNKGAVAETYVGETTKTSLLDVMEDSARGYRNAGEDLGELKDSYDEPVVDLQSYLPK